MSAKGLETKAGLGLTSPLQTSSGTWTGSSEPSWSPCQCKWQHLRSRRRAMRTRQVLCPSWGSLMVVGEWVLVRESEWTSTGLQNPDWSLLIKWLFH